MINENLIGERHGRLTVIAKSPRGFKWWICKCDCGNTKELIASRFKTYQSCGCLEKENKITIGKRSQTHGMSNSILYSKYCSMKARCFNPNYKHYGRYGGRGISICDEWLGKNGFSNFAKWAYENGYDDYKHGYDQSIDRINFDGNYSPENCRWVTQKEQARNRNITLRISYNGEVYSLGEFCETNNINYDWARRRFPRGQSAEVIMRDWINKKT